MDSFGQPDVDLDAALDRVVAAARAHLAAVRLAEGEPDDDAVWLAYIALNNASHAYDALLNDVFNEVTPWDVEAIATEGSGDRVSTVVGGDLRGGAADPYPHVVSVRQRRDYRVPSVSALLEAARVARGPHGQAPLDTVAEAVLELLACGDGSLAMLDVSELHPLDGVVVVAEVADPLGAAGPDGDDPQAPFRLGAADRAVGRLDERAMFAGSPPPGDPPPGG